MKAEQITLPEDYSAPTFEGVPTNKLRELAAKHRRLYLLSSEEHGAFVVRLPTQGEMSRAFSQMGEAPTRYTALKSLAGSCVVYPEGGALAELFEDFAGLPAVLGQEISSLSGAGAEFSAKKLARG